LARRHTELRRPGGRGADRRERGGLAEVEREHRDLRRRQRLGGLEVDADDAAFGADALRQHLEPAARPAAEVEHRGVPRQRRCPPQQVLELEGRARAPPLVLGAAVERVLAVVARRRR